MKHNAEPEACDLLLEVEKLGDITQFTDEANFSRICLYLLSNANYATEPEDTEIRQIVYNIYRKHNRFPEALAVALSMDDANLIKQVLEAAEDENVKKQLCFILGRHRAFSIEEENEELLNLMGNEKLSSHYRQLARDLSVEEAKAPKDVYKMHLIENRHC